MSLRLRVATAADAEALARFGERLFRETFEPHNRTEDMDAYCAAAFAAGRQLREIEDMDREVILGEVAGELACYSQLYAGPAPACVTGPDPIELVRFYVDGRWHGQGTAQELMAATRSAAARRGARTLHLGVWERNLRAIAFYRRQGFRDVGSHPFLLGSDRQTDRIMERPIERPGAAKDASRALAVLPVLLLFAA